MSDVLLNSLVGAFADGLAGAIETTTGARPQVASKAAPRFDAAGQLLWRQPLSGLSGTAWVAAAEMDWRDIGFKLLKAAGVDDGDDEAIRSAFLEATSRALSALALKVAALAGHEVTCAPGELDNQIPGECAWFRLSWEAGGAPAELALGFDLELVRALEKNAEESITAQLETERANEPAVQKSRTFDLLLEVELPVSVSFGRAQVALKDVLKLTTGSIVELNRRINEPVEVIVNNCVIARGEVVVVDGNFGVRIQQVISRQERLRTMN